MDTARGAGRLLAIGLAVALVVALVLLALDNTDDARVGYVVGDFSAPMWTIVVIAAVAGVIIGWLIRHRRRSA
ncbi:MAG: LapA family protein [Ilumatobacteraceae bacterium]